MTFSGMDGCNFPDPVLKCVAYNINKEGVKMTLKSYGHFIKTLHFFLDQIMARELSDFELTPSQARIVGFLIHSETPPCARDIEEAFQLTHPTVSGILSRLEQKGFIEFRPDENDRRCKRIYLLQKGLELDETMHKTILATEDTLVQDFTEEEKQQFADLLRRAIDNLGGSPCKRKHKEEPKL